MNAIPERLILRSICHPDIVIDHTARRSLLAKAGLMLLAGALDPGDGLPVTDAVRRLAQA